MDSGFKLIRRVSFDFSVPTSVDLQNQENIKLSYEYVVIWENVIFIHCFWELSLEL